LGVCDLRTTLIFLEAPSGLLAAGFWFYASWISWGLFRAPKVGDFNKNTRQNYIYNAIAALLAGIAAMLQRVVFYMPSCKDFS
jgi:nitric oxide reductase large subunit